MAFKFKGCVHPDYQKSPEVPVTVIAPPPQVVIPMIQHIGAPNKPLVEKGDYVKLDNITLGYTFNFMNKYVQNCRLYIALRNVATITDYSGIDPEVSVSGLTPGVDYYNRYPATRSYTFGISVRF